MGVKSFRDEWEGKQLVKHKNIGVIETLYESEGGDAAKSFARLKGICDKIWISLQK